MWIRWKRFDSYDAAQDQRNVIYLHEHDGKPICWGIANRAVFGGSARYIKGERVTPRYAKGYRHWIDACLACGASLHIGHPSPIYAPSLARPGDAAQ
jgi:hypothetical protein